MKTKTLLVLLTIGLIATLSLASAAQWIYSESQRKTVISYSVTLDPVPDLVHGSVIEFTGSVHLGALAVPNISVTIFGNGTGLATGMTNSQGLYVISYPVNEPDGTVYDIKAGIEL